MAKRRNSGITYAILVSQVQYPVLEKWRTLVLIGDIATSAASCSHIGREIADNYWSG